MVRAEGQNEGQNEGQHPRGHVQAVVGWNTAEQ